MTYLYNEDLGPLCTDIDRLGNDFKNRFLSVEYGDMWIRFTICRGRRYNLCFLSLVVKRDFKRRVPSYGWSLYNEEDD